MRLLPTALLAALLCGCASSPPPFTDVHPSDDTAVQTYLSQLITHEMRRHDVPGLSIAIVDDQRVVWSRGFGFADEAHHVAATADTLYRVGSISKLFTDMAAMQLVEQGRLDLDQPVQSYLPDFAIQERTGQSSAITPRMLMTHHAGLPRDILKGFMTAAPDPFCAVVPQLRNTVADHPPGLVFSYSNVGISVLGCLVQQITSQPFADHMRQDLLLPMGMSHAAFEPGVSSSNAMARGHLGRQPATEPALRDVPAGGLNASVNDMSQFMAMIFAGGVHDGHRILQAASVAEMLRPQNIGVPLDLNFHVGLGWMLSTLGANTIEGGGVVAHHAGATRLFHSQIYILPEHKLGVVVLANSTDQHVVDRIASTALALALERKTGIRQTPLRDIPLADHAPPTSDLSTVTGLYTTIAGPVRIALRHGHLSADVAGHTLDLHPRTDGLYALDYRLLGLFPIKLGTLSDLGLSFRQIAGHDALVARIGEQEMMVGDRVPPPAQLWRWPQRWGDYAIVNLGRDTPLVSGITLREDEGHLMVDFTLADHPDQTLHNVLQPLSDDEAVLLDGQSDGGARVHVVQVDGEDWLEISGYQLRRIQR